ncbi:MAG: hydrogenase maturation nickel metallochaperone HypA [Acidobacteria bacterium]|uniref:Hydrogenase maturation factor HypA n=1 Tax=Candidatus Polarisedimenticola svalbardensis TaxID=2886004 RepID=A0A8J6Y2B3_9BACT|nr:hydrogenase maturation nickel metallochaperone HypA [Candidatus Polarisedimenticola svalbardensis]
MHEMSIVASVLNIAEKEARSADAQVIRTIEIEVGQLAGVEIPALEFGFEVARRGTLAGEAELIIHDIPGLGHCRECNKNVAIDSYIPICPTCGELVPEVLQGKELRVRSIIVD